MVLSFKNNYRQTITIPSPFYIVLINYLLDTVGGPSSVGYFPDWVLYPWDSLNLYLTLYTPNKVSKYVLIKKNICLWKKKNPPLNVLNKTTIIEKT